MMYFMSDLREPVVAKPKLERRWRWPWSKPRPDDALALFHKAWDYAHDHPNEIAGGYNKAAFGHVHFWLSKISG